MTVWRRAEMLAAAWVLVAVFCYFHFHISYTYIYICGARGVHVALCGARGIQGYFIFVFRLRRARCLWRGVWCVDWARCVARGVVVVVVVVVVGVVVLCFVRRFTISAHSFVFRY
jgi:hypothetical protein